MQKQKTVVPKVAPAMGKPMAKVASTVAKASKEEDQESVTTKPETEPSKIDKSSQGKRPPKRKEPDTASEP